MLHNRVIRDLFLAGRWTRTKNGKRKSTFSRKRKRDRSRGNGNGSVKVRARTERGEERRGNNANLSHVHRSGFVFRWIIGLRSAGQPTFNNASSPGWCCSRHSSRFFARNPPTSPRPRRFRPFRFRSVYVTLFPIETGRNSRKRGKFTSRVANRIKIGQREKKEERKKSLFPPSYHHRPSTSSTNETRTELERRFSVDDHKKCRAVESIYRSLNLISRLSHKFNWFQSSITDELRYARGKGGDSFQSLLLGA